MSNINQLELKRDILYPVGDDIQAVVIFCQQVADFINMNHDYETFNIFCRGSSGAIMAGVFAPKLKDTLKSYVIHVKKEGESSHYSRVTKYDPSYKSIIIDDFIQSGSTINAIFDALCEVSEIDYVVVQYGIKMSNRLKFPIKNIIGCL